MFSVITIKENKDPIEILRAAHAVCGDVRMCAWSIESAEGHTSVTSATRVHIWWHNTISHSAVKYAGAGEETGKSWER